MTEAEIDRRVEEARAGYNAEVLKTRMWRPARGAAASQAVPVRLATEEVAAVMARSERENLISPEASGAALSAWAQAAHKHGISSRTTSTPSRSRSMPPHHNTLRSKCAHSTEILKMEGAYFAVNSTM